MTVKNVYYSEQRVFIYSRISDQYDFGIKIVLY
jgi:hypothetical protein